MIVLPSYVLCGGANFSYSIGKTYSALDNCTELERIRGNVFDPFELRTPRPCPPSSPLSWPPSWPPSCHPVCPPSSPACWRSLHQAVPPPPPDWRGISAGVQKYYIHGLLVLLGSLWGFLCENNENKTYMKVFTGDRFDFGLATACCYCIIFGNFP